MIAAAIATMATVEAATNIRQFCRVAFVLKQGHPHIAEPGWPGGALAHAPTVSRWPATRVTGLRDSSLDPASSPTREKPEQRKDDDDDDYPDDDAEDAPPFRGVLFCPAGSTL